MQLGSFLITEVAQILGLLFTVEKVMYYLDKNGLGYILGDFRTWQMPPKNLPA
jgi:hypothetical protein